MKNYKIWLIVICVGLITICSVLCLNFYQSWQEEKLASSLWEVAYNLSETNREYYQQLYYDCHNQTEPMYRWEK